MTTLLRFRIVVPADHSQVLKYALMKATNTIASLVMFMLRSSSAWVTKPLAVTTRHHLSSCVSRRFSASPRLFPEELNIIYDSKCNVCKLEIDFLRKRDQKRNGNNPKLRFTDLEGETGVYRPEDPVNGGVSYSQGMKSMHGVGPDGSVMTGVPVFVKAYEQVGLGWLFSISKVPGLKQLLDIGYVVFARYRTNITRGQPVDEIIAAYGQKIALEESQVIEDCEVCKKT